MVSTTIVTLALELPSSAFLIFLLIALASLAFALLLLALALDHQNCTSGRTPLHLRNIPLFVLLFKFSGSFTATGFGPITSFICFQPLGHRHCLFQVALEMGTNVLLQMGYQS